MDNRTFQLGKIHSTALISSSAIFGNDITIGANTIIYDNVELGDHSIIGPNTILGEPLAQFYQYIEYVNPKLTIGENSLIRSGSIIYAGSVIGDNFETGHRVTIRENTIMGRHCRVGTLSDIQGYCHIGDYTRLHSNVHIGQKSNVGSFVWIYPYVVLTNDPYPPSNISLGVTVEDYAVIATMSVVLPGVTIGRDALVGAKSMVRSDVPPETVVVGSPANIIAKVGDIRSKYDGEHVYPWRYHFDHGMPWEGIGYDEWIRRNSTPSG